MAAIMIAGFAQAAFAQQAPDSDNGRYTMSQTADGVLRLDTRTGAISTCTNKSGWVCRVVPDERAALDIEIGRLQRDNAALKSQLADRVSGKTNEALPKTDLEKPKDSPGKQGTADSQSAQSGKDTVIELRLPPQEELVAALDRVWQQLVGIAGRMQKKIYEKI
ncbi:MAG: hypothetical protein K2W78_04880 [Xanthobacteraceae bacterium]|nr:hypothetical protein [Xanthobacteraceae bacterium]